MNLHSFLHPNITEVAIAAGVALVVIVLLASWLTRRRPRKLNSEYYKKKWQEAQSLCSHESTWPLAVINADKLLDDVLKKCKFKGKTMGERLGAAQHVIKNNDTVWFGHKLSKKLVHENMKKLKKKDVLEALLCFREALKDLGALK